jgi:hypothetical protein
MLFGPQVEVLRWLVLRRGWQECSGYDGHWQRQEHAVTRTAAWGVLDADAIAPTDRGRRSAIPAITLQLGPDVIAADGAMNRDVRALRVLRSDIRHQLEKSFIP